MIKISEQTAKELVMLLSYIRMSTGNDISGIHRHVRTQMRNMAFTPQTPSVHVTAHDLVADGWGGGGVPAMTVDQLGEELGMGLRGSERDDESDMRLLDQILDIVSEPMALSEFRSDSLDQIRKAILLPSESIDLREKIKAVGGRCRNCGKTLTSRMVVFWRDEEHGSNPEPILVCLSCSGTANVECAKANCHNPIVVYPSSFFCPEHAKESKELKIKPTKTPATLASIAVDSGRFNISGVGGTASLPTFTTNFEGVRESGVTATPPNNPWLTAAETAEATARTAFEQSIAERAARSRQRIARGPRDLDSILNNMDIADRDDSR